MWVPSQEDVVDIFARHFEALHRSGSVQRARQTANSLKERGDHEGHSIWRRVADKIENDLRRDRPLTRRRLMERT